MTKGSAILSCLLSLENPRYVCNLLKRLTERGVLLHSVSVYSLLLKDRIGIICAAMDAPNTCAWESELKEVQCCSEGFLLFPGGFLFFSDDFLRMEIDHPMTFQGSCCRACSEGFSQVVSEVLRCCWYCLSNDQDFFQRSTAALNLFQQKKISFKWNTEYAF